MTRPRCRDAPIWLSDKYYERDQGRVYLTGIQALVRLPRPGSGSTGGGWTAGSSSPVTAARRRRATISRLIAVVADLAAHDVHPTPGVRSWRRPPYGDRRRRSARGRDRIATGCSPMVRQGAGRRPGLGRVQHANASGNPPRGVLAIAGDDHLAKSSTAACQSEFHSADCEIPVLNPADLQDVVD